MQFEWDEAKRRSNKAKHGFDFTDAHRVFSGLMLVAEDVREDYNEPRFIGIGKLGARVVVIVYTYRGGAYRIISMRKANGREQKTYKIGSG